MAKRIPTANMFWRDIPPAACVIDLGNVYVAKIGRRSAVVYWGSQDATAAQKTLKRRAAKGCRR